MNNNENIHNIVGDYKFGFKTDVKNVVDTGKGLSEEVIRTISKLKNEPDWMLEFRLKSYEKFKELDNPSFGPKLEFDFENINYYKGNEKDLKELPDNVKNELNIVMVENAIEVLDIALEKKIKIENNIEKEIDSNSKTV